MNKLDWLIKNIYTYNSLANRSYQNINTADVWVNNTVFEFSKKYFSDFMRPSNIPEKPNSFYFDGVKFSFCVHDDLKDDEVFIIPTSLK